MSINGVYFQVYRQITAGEIQLPEAGSCQAPSA